MQVRFGARSWFPVVALVALSATGCSETPQKRLQGTWKGSGVSHMGSEHEADALGWAKTVRFDFQERNVTVQLPTEVPRTGTYEVVRQRGDRVTLAFKRKDGTIDEATFRLSDDRKTLTWELGSQREVVLTRVQET